MAQVNMLTGPRDILWNMLTLVPITTESISILEVRELDAYHWIKRLINFCHLMMHFKAFLLLLAAINNVMAYSCTISNCFSGQK